MRNIASNAVRGEIRLTRPAILIAVAGGLAISGCSMPIPGLIDPVSTGSVKSPTYPFATEDWPRAEPAVVEAIHADSGEKPAEWGDTQSGRRGSIVGIGARFDKHGATCRAFVARIAEDQAIRAVQGEACEKAGHATVSNAGPFRGA